LSVTNPDSQAALVRFFKAKSHGGKRLPPSATNLPGGSIHSKRILRRCQQIILQFRFRQRARINFAGFLPPDSCQRVSAAPANAGSVNFRNNAECAAVIFSLV
jgi:hypothetical protein